MGASVSSSRLDPLPLGLGSQVMCHGMEADRLMSTTVETEHFSRVLAICVTAG